MLVLTRKVGQRLRIGDQISVTVVHISGGAVRLGIEAPPEYSVVREKLREPMERSQPAGEEARVE